MSKIVRYLIEKTDSGNIEDWTNYKMACEIIDANHIQIKELEAFNGKLNDDESIYIAIYIDGTAEFVRIKKHSSNVPLILPNIQTLEAFYQNLKE